MSRFIVWSDLHLNLWSYGSTVVGGRNTRLSDQQEVIRQIDEYSFKNCINTILFCGDFFHKHSKVDAEVLKAVYESLQDLCVGRELVFVVGNHDMATKDGSIHSLDLLRQYGTIVDKPMTFSVYNDTIIHAHPYTENKQDLVRFLKRSPTNSVVLMHQGVSGVPVNSKGFTLNESLTPDMIPPTVLAFTGHYHSPCKVTENLIIPGAPLQLNWTDAGEPRGWLDVTWEEGEEPNIQFIQSVAPKFVEIPASMLAKIEKGGLRDHFVRVLAPEGVDTSDLREHVMADGARSVEISIQRADNEVELTSSHFDTVEGLFDDYVKTKNLPENMISVGRQIMEGTYCASIEG